MRRFLSVVVLSLFGLLAGSAALSEEITYRKHIAPLFESNCLACHGSQSAPEYYAFKEDKDRWMRKGQGMRMDTYSHLIFYTAWPDTGSLMRRLDDGKGVQDGKQGNMYRYLGETEEQRQKNLNVFKSWVGNWTLKRWKDISKEDMEGIKVKY